MAGSKKEIELLLSFIDAKERIGSGNSRHIIEAELLYPRTGVALKTSTMTQRLSSGALDVRGLPWYRRILFKENVEGRFAIKFRISRSLGQAAFNAAMRYIGLDCGMFRPPHEPYTEAEYADFCAKADALGIFKRSQAVL